MGAFVMEAVVERLADNAPLHREIAAATKIMRAVDRDFRVPPIKLEGEQVFPLGAAHVEPGGLARRGAQPTAYPPKLTLARCGASTSTKATGEPAWRGVGRRWRPSRRHERVPHVGP